MQGTGVAPAKSAPLDPVKAHAARRAGLTTGQGCLAPRFPVPAVWSGKCEVSSVLGRWTHSPFVSRVRAPLDPSGAAPARIGPRRPA